MLRPALTAVKFQVPTSGVCSGVGVGVTAVFLGGYGRFLLGASLGDLWELVVKGG
jgi:hypothetical protein